MAEEEQPKSPVVGDLVGLGKIADSKIVNKLYDHAFAGAAKEAGELLTDLAKAGRLLVGRMLNLDPERYKRYATIVHDAVPVERQIAADPAIAGPVLESMRYLEHNNPLIELYLTLLKRAIDKERVNEAHPAFAGIIGQLSPDEALILYILKKRNRMLTVVSWRHENTLDCIFPFDLLVYPQQYPMYVEHLNSFGLIEAYSGSQTGEANPVLDKRPTEPSFYYTLQINSYSSSVVRTIISAVHCLSLSAFGIHFSNACIPDDFPGYPTDIQAYK